MAWRFTHLVEEGELDNTTKGRVIGWIKLAGREQPLQLDLRGNCHYDLAGWRFRLVRVRPEPEWDNDHNNDLTGLAEYQIGEAGDITAAQEISEFDCPIEEFIQRKELGEPPPVYHRRSIYVEWYSGSNGRVVIQSTRFEVERLGQQQFEITDEDLRLLEEENQRKLKELEDQGYFVNETPMGFEFYQVDEDEIEDEQTRRRLEEDIQESLRDDLDDEDENS